MVPGLLIAVGLEQTVESIHHDRQLTETREALRRERSAKVARFAVETLEENREIPLFQEDLAVFTDLKDQPGAASDTWPGKRSPTLTVTSTTPRALGRSGSPSQSDESMRVCAQPPTSAARNSFQGTLDLRGLPLPSVLLP